MNKPSLYERIHWRAFNFLAKVFGYGLVFVSLILVLSVVITMIEKPLMAEYVAWQLVIFTPLILLGVLIIKAKPYYPEEYQQWFTRSAHNKSQERTE